MPWGTAPVFSLFKNRAELVVIWEVADKHLSVNVDRLDFLKKGTIIIYQQPKQHLLLYFTTGGAVTPYIKSSKT